MTYPVDPREVQWTVGKLEECSEFHVDRPDEIAFVRKLMKDAAELIRLLSATGGSK